MAFSPPEGGAVRTGWLLFCLVLTGASVATAGPPFQTDDPEPVPYRHYEAYLFPLLDSTSVAGAIQVPAAEFNWGAVPNLQLHLILPMTANLPSGGPYTFGFGDAEQSSTRRQAWGTILSVDGCSRETSARS